MPVSPNITGQRFFRLTVVCRVFKKNKKNSYWLCECDCGGLKSVRRQHLLSGDVRSCGCLASEVSGTVHKKHGLSETMAYRVWHGMIARCYSKNSDSYKLYGGREITVCERWRKSVVNFFKDMGEPGPKMTIERLDNNKGYSPSNCRWATQVEQANNKRTNVILEYKGKELTVAQWSKETGLPQTAIRGRLRLGWSIKDALTLPIAERVKYKRRKMEDGNNKRL